MFNSISGRISGRRGTKIFIENGGIEWAVEVSRQSYEHILCSEEEVLRIFTYLHHREDSMLLFGFSHEQERDLFLKLLRVSGIGPRQALKILSGIEAENLVRFIESEDADALSRIPGLGKKTAAKIILALRGSIAPLNAEGTSSSFSELIDALVDMGFERKAAENVIGECANSEDFATIPEKEREHELFRRAIVSLSSE